MSITAQFLHIEPLNVKVCEQLLRHNNRSMHGIIFSSDIKCWIIVCFEELRLLDQLAILCSLLVCLLQRKLLYSNVWWVL